MVMVNLEDLWHETEPQNVPGTQHRAAELAAQGKVFVRGVLDAGRRGRAAPAAETRVRKTTLPDGAPEGS